jgi:hypothetical protein
MIKGLEAMVIESLTTARAYGAGLKKKNPDGVNRPGFSGW